MVIYCGEAEYNTGVLTARDSGTRFPMIPYAELVLRGTRFNLNQI